METVTGFHVFYVKKKNKKQTKVGFRVTVTFGLGSGNFFLFIFGLKLHLATLDLG